MNDPRRERWLQAAADAIYGRLASSSRELAEIAVDAYENARAEDEPSDRRTT